MKIFYHSGIFLSMKEIEAKTESKMQQTNPKFTQKSQMKLR